MSSYWDDDNNVRDFLKYAAEKLDIKENQDWFRVTQQHLISLGAGSKNNIKFNSLIEGILLRQGGLIPLLTRIYPGINWNDRSYVVIGGPSKAQSYLFKVDLL